MLIKHWVRGITNGFERRNLKNGDLRVLYNLGIQIFVKNAGYLLVVRWLRPSLSRLKLNLDGSCIGNPGMGGGGEILHNHEGKLIFIFSKFFGSVTNNEAKLRAVVKGIKYCQQLGFFCIDIECDSLIVVDWLMGKYCTV